LLKAFYERKKIKKKGRRKVRHYNLTGRGEREVDSLPQEREREEGILHKERKKDVRGGGLGGDLSEERGTIGAGGEDPNKTTLGLEGKFEGLKRVRGAN